MGISLFLRGGTPGVAGLRLGEGPLVLDAVEHKPVNLLRVALEAPADLDKVQDLQVVLEELQLQGCDQLLVLSPDLLLLQLRQWVVSLVLGGVICEN